ncbi:uncharacterized protein K452DRAFT_344927 [Aplosporella prunicola CBS 121167]|uniref:CCHC-type domain-containing protein n=1 Tax=Aplosporella prunicola CBS 121167 TaxID=1176127 RepID=A0A6A6BN18_9PEZI|nr:uncharacterized protein K452DRAFT_344927 [Aplosporella prunicola CBS 121167]KAF2144803.1 hypothetical protein K452DRAFT_344927 [Aplosporella prunicola CBS 121167]
MADREASPVPKLEPLSDDEASHTERVSHVPDSYKNITEILQSPGLHDIQVSVDPDKDPDGSISVHIHLKINPGKVTRESPEENMVIECGHCHGQGHAAGECPEKESVDCPDEKPQLCHECGSPDHVPSDCSDRVLCHNCRQTGHCTIKCPEAICNRCKVKGHMRSACRVGQVRRDCDHCGQRDHRSSDCPEAPKA